MKYFFALIFTILNITYLYSQNYKLIPLNHSNKWYNGSEWSIDAKEDFEVKLLFNDFKSGKVLFSIVMNSKLTRDINIDPDSIYCIAKKFNDERILRSKPKNNNKKTSRSNLSKMKMSDSEYLKYIIAEYDTIKIENSDKLVKNLKGLIGLGFVLDSDNLAINRGYTKIDYYKENLLLKHTIEPNSTHSKLLVIDGYKFIEELVIVIKIDNREFKFPFTSIITDDVE